VHQKSEKGVWNTQIRCPRANPAARARLSDQKKWCCAARVSRPECPRGGGALERVCFCLFIGSNGWSLMACDYTTSWQSNALHCQIEQSRETISARLAKMPDWLWRGERYTRYTICGFLCLHCSMGAPRVLIDLGSRFYCWVCIARRRGNNWLAKLHGTKRWSFRSLRELAMPLCSKFYFVWCFRKHQNRAAQIYCGSKLLTREFVKSCSSGSFLFIGSAIATHQP
jgi:hypothetical protein